MTRTYVIFVITDYIKLFYYARNAFNFDFTCLRKDSKYWIPLLLLLMLLLQFRWSTLGWGLDDWNSRHARAVQSLISLAFAVTIMYKYTINNRQRRQWVEYYIYFGNMTYSTLLLYVQCSNLDVLIREAQFKNVVQSVKLFRDEVLHISQPATHHA